VQDNDFNQKFIKAVLERTANNQNFKILRKLFYLYNLYLLIFIVDIIYNNLLNLQKVKVTNHSNIEFESIEKDFSVNL